MRTGLDAKVMPDCRLALGLGAEILAQVSRHEYRVVMSIGTRERQLPLECRISELLTAAASGDEQRVCALLDGSTGLRAESSQWSPRRIMLQLSRVWQYWCAQPQVQALHVAVINGHVEIARLLLSRGAGPSVKDASGATPLMAAYWHGELGLGDSKPRNPATMF